MISGIIYKKISRIVSENEMFSIMKSGEVVAGKKDVHCYRNLGFIWHNNYHGESCFLQDHSNRMSVVFEGKIYNFKDMQKSLGEKFTDKNPAQLVLLLYLRYGEGFVGKLRGKFAFALYHHKRHLLILARDHIGIEPLYYLEDSEKIVFSTSLMALLQYPGVKRELNIQAVCQFLFYCYNPAFYTFFLNVMKLRPGHLFLYCKESSTIKRYWKLSFANILDQDEGEISEQLREKIDEAVKIRMDSNGRSGVFLSGGMDSSTVLSFAQKYVDTPLYTFSYRCRGVSYDESKYARIVSDFYQTNHSLVEYGSEQVKRIAELVKRMDEPFCDLGINIATELLGEDAHNKVSYVLTGDGGDELFGGHPVYLADQAGQWIEHIPSFIKNPFLLMGSKLKDSDKKKDFRVKWKRFSQSVRFPASLFSHRWRIYYLPDQLISILNKEFGTGIKDEELYQPIAEINQESNGTHLLNKSLYSDYLTVVGFYLRRMDLIRYYGIESRFPLLDYPLVEFGATIHPKLKIRNQSETKYILKQTMRHILPKEIVFRKDKLGHSIPMKNWMRSNKAVQDYIVDILSEKNLNRRGLFDSKGVSQMISEHLTKRDNHSHRLWALLVLELWLREHLDHS
ncbi:asparagine synthase (glutamine-hydrolyzing) [bacterium]|nr:asparagine synthase (glutamine-hydrolyzing) [bacterium]